MTVLDDDHRAFLAVAMRGALFANRRDTTPTGWPMTLLWRGDDHLYVNTYRKAAKADVLVRDGRVGVIARHDGRALAVQGDAVLVPQEEAAPMFPSMVRTDGFVPPEQAARTVQRLREGKRCLFRITPGTVWWLA
jgi:hypothetical protein